jgi:hypothetical protein
MPFPSTQRGAEPSSPIFAHRLGVVEAIRHDADSDAAIHAELLHLLQDQRPRRVLAPGIARWPDCHFFLKKRAGRFSIPFLKKSHAGWRD